MKNKLVLEKYQNLKIKEMTSVLTDKEKSFVVFCDNQLVKPNMPSEDKDLVESQAEKLLKALSIN